VKENTNHMVDLKTSAVWLLIFAKVLESLPRAVPWETSNYDVINTCYIAWLNHLHIGGTCSVWLMLGGVVLTGTDPSPRPEHFGDCDLLIENDLPTSNLQSRPTESLSNFDSSPE